MYFVSILGVSRYLWSQQDWPLTGPCWLSWSRGGWRAAPRPGRSPAPPARSPPGSRSPAPPPVTRHSAPRVTCHLHQPHARHVARRQVAVPPQAAGQQGRGRGVAAGRPRPRPRLPPQPDLDVEQRVGDVEPRVQQRDVVTARRLVQGNL